MRTENHSAELRAARRTNPRLAFSGVQEEPYANYVEDGWILYPKDEVEPQDLQHSKTVFNERIKFRTSKPDLSFTTTNFRTIKPNLDFTTTNFR
ncbi:MAG: hypothetical protein F9K26_06795 [Ignavibacteriaceae bacterium]|nr:MAG: hypothetical protein F9K26_06795 [Ignavibacteriaceae bacterium]MBV6443920.1 hypothetical protein [Ignavibacteriaceae bacterium]